MRAFEVLPEEQFRVDLFLIRTMGDDTQENHAYFTYFNPNLKNWEFRAGLVFKVPDSEDIASIVHLRALHIVAMER